jgi:ribosomal protein L37AE/L43A
MKVLTCPNCGMIDIRRLRKGKYQCTTCGTLIKISSNHSELDSTKLKC